VFAAPILARLLDARFECVRALQISRLRWRYLQRRVLYTLRPHCKRFLQRHIIAPVVDGLRCISYLPNIVTILDTQRCMPHRFGVSSIVHLSLLFTWYQMTRVSSIPVSSSIAAAAAYCRHVRPAPMTSSALTSAISQGRRPCLHGIVLHLFLLLHP
jgi:hypothetical protein